MVVYQLGLFFWFLMLVGVPVCAAWGLGWFSPPREHVTQLVIAGVLLVLAVVASAIAWATVYVCAKDFMAPLMAAESIGAAAGWRRLREVIWADRVGVFIYLAMKLVLSIGAGLVVLVFILALVVPMAVMAVAVVAGAAGAGASWNAVTIALSAAAGVAAIGLIVVVSTLVSVPFAVFFPAYGLYFLGSRVVSVEVWMRAALEPAVQNPAGQAVESS